MGQENEMLPSEMFTQIDWGITDSVCEQGSILGDRNVSTNTSCLIQKVMLFNYKEDLQLAIRKYCIKEHYKIIVVESN